jgi:hypothetical protein
MSFTLVSSHISVNAASAASLVYTGNITSVQAGDLVVACLGNLEGTPTTYSLSDGTSTFSLATGSDEVFGAGAAHIETHYLLASVATGSPTYTLTYGAARTYRVMGIYVFRPTAAVSVGNSSSSSGTGTAISSGNITVSSSDLIAFACAGTINTTAAPSPITINGVAATGSLHSNYFTVWYAEAAAGYTGAAAGTISSDSWGANVTAFTIGAGGGGSTIVNRESTRRGVGRGVLRGV